MSYDVVVVGSFMMDHSVYVHRRPGPGETVRGESFQVSEGGKGFNQAVAAARSGAAVAMVGRLGEDDLGVRFLARLAAEGIDFTGIRCAGPAATGVGVPVVDASGQNAIIIVSGANDELSVEDIEMNADAIRGAKVLLLQHEIPDGSGGRAAAIARAAGVFVVLNPGPAGPLDAFRGHVDVLIPNEIELDILSPGEDRIAQAHTLSAEMGGCDVIVTLGGDGALVVTQDRVWSVPALPTAVTDTTGAGDCFCGALAARLARGDKLESAIEYATVAASIAVTRKGAAGSAPRWNEVRDRLGSARGAVLEPASADRGTGAP